MVGHGAGGVWRLLEDRYLTGLPATAEVLNKVVSCEPGAFLHIKGNERVPQYFRLQLLSSILSPSQHSKGLSWVPETLLLFYLLG